MTTQLRVRVLGAGAGVLLLGALACGKADDARSRGLQQDLDLVRQEVDLAGTDAGLELAPATSQGTNVMSDIERIPTGKAPTTSQRAPAPRSAPLPKVVAPEPTPMEEEEAPVTVPAPAEVPTPAPAPAAAPAPTDTAPSQRPRPTPKPAQKAPPGGWKTTDDVIKNAPFPINP